MCELWSATQVWVIIHLLPQQLKGISVTTEQLTEKQWLKKKSIVKIDVHDTLTARKL